MYVEGLTALVTKFRAVFVGMMADRANHSGSPRTSKHLVHRMGNDISVLLRISLAVLYLNASNKSMGCLWYAVGLEPVA
jgi:hypothetical protein